MLRWQLLFQQFSLWQGALVLSAPGGPGNAAKSGDFARSRRAE